VLIIKCIILIKIIGQNQSKAEKKLELKDLNDFYRFPKDTAPIADALGIEREEFAEEEDDLEDDGEEEKVPQIVEKKKTGPKPKTGVRGPRQCKNCQEFGHTAKTCTKIKNEEREPGLLPGLGAKKTTPPLESMDDDIDVSQDEFEEVRDFMQEVGSSREVSEKYSLSLRHTNAIISADSYSAYKKRKNI
jgi:DNA-binding Lrp family transcriptional regulator